MNVAAFVNGGTVTSFQLELSVKIDAITPADVTIVSFYDDSLSDADPDVAALDIDFVPLGATSRFDPTAYRKLREFLHDIDIFHTHYNFVGSAGRLAALATDTNIVNTEHTDHNRLSHLQNLANAFTYPVVDVMIYNSQSTQASLRSYEHPLLARADNTVVHNGIDFDRIHAGSARSDLPVLPSGPKIVTAARLVPVKNISSLILAMREVLRKIPEAELIIIGDGPEEAKLQKLVAQSEFSDSVSFTGRLEREQVYGVMAQSDVYAVTSFAEGFCNSAVEAMGCGLPIVASDIDVFHEVLGDTALFADPKNPDTIAAKLITLLTDIEQQANRGTAAKNRAASRFTIEQCAHQYYQIYEKLSDPITE